MPFGVELDDQVPGFNLFRSPMGNNRAAKPGFQRFIGNNFDQKPVNSLIYNACDIFFI
jgi:hypothetical protein